jgi:hypothetical protein
MARFEYGVAGHPLGFATETLALARCVVLVSGMYPSATMVVSLAKTGSKAASVACVSVCRMDSLAMVCGLGSEVPLM